MTKMTLINKPIMAAIQMCSSPRVDDNLEIAKQLITDAAKNHANLVVLPEMFAIMSDSPENLLSQKEKLGQGKIQTFLAEFARLNNIWIIGGTIPIECHDSNKIRAASLVFDNQGHCVARYDKIHLFDATLSKKETYKESNTTEAGDNIVVVNTPFGRIGLSVCYDVRFPELFRALLNKGAEIITIPAAFTVKTGEAHWELLARSRAVENFCYVVGACQGGMHYPGRKTYGNSIIIEPWGAIIAKKEGIESGVIYAEINLDKIAEARKLIPSQTHQRLFCHFSK